MALVRDHSWIIPVPIESNRFSKWRAHAYHRSIWVPHPTLPPWSSVHRYTFFLSERWNPGILPQHLSSICFFFFLFFFFFSKPNLLYLEPTFGTVGPKHTETFFPNRLYLLRLYCGLSLEDGKLTVSAGDKMIIWSLSTNMNEVCWSPILLIYLFFFSLFWFFFLFCSQVIISWSIYRNYGVYRFAVGK